MSLKENCILMNNIGSMLSNEFYQQNATALIVFQPMLSLVFTTYVKPTI